jgi:hypothetical protein
MNTLKLEVVAMPKMYQQKSMVITAQHYYGMVRLKIDDKFVELPTTIAYDIGRAILLADVAPNEMIMLVINGEQVELLLPFAQKIAIALVRKADDADDWQIKTKRKKI